LLRQAAVIVIAYLLGSIPFGYLIVRATQGADVRTSGSGGTGATNVSRRAGKMAGVFTLLLDALKGVAAIAIARTVLKLETPWVEHGSGPGGLLPQSAQWWLAAAAVAVIVGHIFPVWLGFRGGKGVATGVGVFLMLTPFALALAAVVFLIVAWWTRYVSLASILAAVTIPLFVMLPAGWVRPFACGPLLGAAVTGAALIVFAHRGNIRRLLQGTETKFS
jgi:glycerol-3-phosphate acyltransferase PlsY